MSLRRLSATVLAAAMILAAGSPAHSGPIEADWPRLAFAQDGDCALDITGNGKVLRVSAEGLAPGRPLRFTLTNAGMKPIAWTIRADGGGRWTQHYMPFLWGRRGGAVAVTIDAGDCRLATAVPWRRDEGRVIP